MALRANLLKLRDLRNGVRPGAGLLRLFRPAGGQARHDQPRRWWTCTARFLKELKPLYLQLHTWVKYEMAKKYQAARAPGPSPPTGSTTAGARTGPASWTADLDPYFKGWTTEQVIHTAENFYTSLGFPSCPSLLDEVGPLPGAGRRSAQEEHPRLLLAPRPGHDIRAWRASSPTWNGSRPATTSWATAIISSATRGPRCRRCCAPAPIPAFHEGIGELVALASSQVPYLQPVGVLPPDFQADATAFLLNDALATPSPSSSSPRGTMAALGGRRLRAQPARRPDGTPAGGSTSGFPGRGAPVAARRRVLRRRHQDPHQRQPLLLLSTTPSPRCSSSSCTTTSPRTSSTSRHSAELRQPQGRRRLPEDVHGEGRHRGLAEAPEGRHRRGSLHPGHGGVLPALDQWLEQQNKGRQIGWE